VTRLCAQCHIPIPQARLDALPQTRTCVACSTVAPPLGHMTWEHKTAPTFQFTTPTQQAWFHKHRRLTAGARLPMVPKA